jgi:outer membrane lipoprotein-sorting protein
MKIKNRIVSFLILILLALLSLSSAAFAAGGFSADAVMTDKKGKTTQAKMYISYSTWSQRMEPLDQPNYIMIVRMDRQVMWTIDKSAKMYMEMSLRPGMAPAPAASGSDKAPGEEERVLLGTETIEGRLADKYRVTHRSGNDRYVSFLWLLQENSFPIKTQNEDTTTIFRNLIFAEPAPELFEVPQGYQKMSMPFGR